MASKSSNTSPVYDEDKRDELFNLLSEESDRGLVLVSASFISDYIEHLLRARFSVEGRKPKSLIDPLFCGFGPLSSFAAKIKIAYAFDLIDRWVYKDLEILRKIRNEFAHSTEIASFDQKNITTLTEKLVGSDRAAEYFMKENKKPNQSKKSSTKKKSANKLPVAKKERVRLILAVSYIAGLLHSYIMFYESDRPSAVKKLL